MLCSRWCRLRKRLRWHSRRRFTLRDRPMRGIRFRRRCWAREEKVRYKSKKVVLPIITQFIRIRARIECWGLRKTQESRIPIISAAAKSSVSTQCNKTAARPVLNNTVSTPKASTATDLPNTPLTLNKTTPSKNKTPASQPLTKTTCSKCKTHRAHSARWAPNKALSNHL